MKPTTIAKLQTLRSKISFTTGTNSLTDEELREIVHLEYGQTLQSVVELFRVICKKYLEIR